MFQARAVPLDNFLKQKITSTLCKLIIQIRSTLQSLAGRFLNICRLINSLGRTGQNSITFPPHLGEGKVPARQ